jgi:hypothetical protein
VTTGRILRGVAVGVVFAILLGAGGVAAWRTPPGETVAAASAAPAPARALAGVRQETTDTSTTDTGTTDTGDHPSGAGCSGPQRHRFRMAMRIWLNDAGLGWFPKLGVVGSIPIARSD